MTRNIDEMISERENEVMGNDYGLSDDEMYEITICNKSSKLSDSIRVHPEHTLGDILELCESLIGVRKKDSKVIFENSKTKRSTSDLQMTMRDFGMSPGDKLLVNGEGEVAAIK